MVTQPKVQVCTAEQPWMLDAERVPIVTHADAVWSGPSTYSPCCDSYNCPHCGMAIKVRRQTEDYEV